MATENRYPATYRLQRECRTWHVLRNGAELGRGGSARDAVADARNRREAAIERELDAAAEQLLTEARWFRANAARLEREWLAPARADMDRVVAEIEARVQVAS